MRSNSARKVLPMVEPISPEALQVTPVAHDSAIPAYVQVEQDLRRLSRSGSVMRIPSEQELARLYGVSRVTVRQSLQRLAAAGLVKREHGKGTTLVPRPEVALDLSLLRSLTEQLREAGHQERIKILRRALVVPPREVAEVLKLKAGAKVVVLRRLVLANGAPLCVNTSWFPAKWVPGLEKVELEDHSVWSHLAAHYGLVAAGSDNAIEFVESDCAEAEPLEVDYSTPLIRLVSCFMDKSARPIEYSVSLWRSTRLRFRFSHTALKANSVI
jgi:GntR family transcriptional regulator